MKISEYLSNVWNAATLQPPPLPKAPKSAQAYPGYRTNVTASASEVRRTDRQLATTDKLVNTRQRASTLEVLRELSISSPELANAVSLALRTGIPEKYTLVARDLDGQVDRAGTLLAHELLRRLTYLGSADGSFGPQQGLQSLSETLGKELLLTGAACVEVALDKARIPASMNPIAVASLKYFEEDKSFKLKQVIGGQEIDLDIPTVIYVALDQLTTEISSSSPMEAAIQPIMTDFEFNNDFRRALKRAVLPRLNAVIDSERVKKMTPPEILSDPQKFAEYQNSIVTQIQNTINGLAAEDALVSFDVVAYSYIDGGHDPSAIIEKVQKVINSKLVASSKSLPVTLGYATTSNASSTESLLYLKHVDAIRRKLNELYSRALTVALRLSGVEAYVEFTYAPIDLRPDRELESFRAMEQSRVLELLSVGFITDDEACLLLTGHLTPDGYVPKSGTGFRANTTVQVSANPTSNNATAVERTLQPDTPTQPKTQPNAQNDTANLAIKAMQDMAYVMSQQTQKPVSLNVSQAPIDLTLNQPAQGKRTINFKRDTEGRLVGAEVGSDD
jgi:hypothetical protein